MLVVFQHVEGDYGLYTWPCAPLLAYLVHTRREWVIGKHVLEVRGIMHRPLAIGTPLWFYLYNMHYSIGNLMQHRSCIGNSIP